jgi:hypothetical protein
MYVTKLNPAGGGPADLIYSTYLGGSDNDCADGLAVDASGAVYLSGYVSSADYPTTVGAFQTTFGGNPYDAFATKLNSSGSGLLYSTFLGGTSAENGDSLAIDASGALYIVGGTGSPNFPTTPGAFQTTCAGTTCNDAFVTQLNPSGSTLYYSTFFGGEDFECNWASAYTCSITIDPDRVIYITGETNSADFPTTAGAYQPACRSCPDRTDAFAAKFDTNGVGLLYATYLGGAGVEFGLGIALDADETAYLTGFTQSPDFPTTTGAYQTTYGGDWDAFVSKMRLVTPRQLYLPLILNNP